MCDLQSPCHLISSCQSRGNFNINSFSRGSDFSALPLPKRKASRFSLLPGTELAFKETSVPGQLAQVPYCQLQRC